ncbi:MAG: methyltransferase domain-containing protein [Planctomycetes bacterium]|nr:methyltransferase domain-containing protein [Planctomycetota bacterium]
MPSTPSEIRARILNEWTAAAQGWRAWEPHIIAFTWPMTQAIVTGLQLREGHRVLDVGCGIGDPTIGLALAVGATGRVVATDPTEEMIAAARSRAASFRLSNVDFHVTPIDDADFPDASFDAVAGRWSFIFCVDIASQLARAHRWLKPGGRIAVGTWTPQEHSPGFEAINSALNRVADIPPLSSTKPGRLQLADPGQLESALSRAGFCGVKVAPVPLSILASDGDQFWRMMTEMGGSLHAVVSGLTPEQRRQVREETIAAVEPFRDGSILRIPALAQIGTGTRS